MARGREWIIARIKEAEALGHKISVERRDPPPEYAARGRVKFWAVCSCGYRSTARATEHTAVSTAIWHIGQVMGESTKQERERAVNGLGRSSDTPTDLPAPVGANL